MTLSVSNLGIDGLEDVEQIGTGGSSRVYRARQTDLDRIVAVKVLNRGHDQGVSKRFDRERKAMGRLSLHEGIVPVYSSGETSHGEPFLVMPYYANGSLQDQIDTGAMEWQTAVSYVDVAAETIAAAHDEGVVHLDLKPANILLTNHGAPRIADFGIAKLTGHGASTTGGAAFTPAYSAPETFLDGVTGPPSDVYGLGATLWALLVGHPPFLTPGEDTNLMAVIGRVVNNPVGDLRHFTPGGICEVIERAMAKDPEDRYQTAREFSLALKNGAAGASSDFRPVVDEPRGTALLSGPPGPNAVPAGPRREETPMLTRMDPVELPPSIASTAAMPSLAQPDPPPSRPLLQETAQPPLRPGGGPPPSSPTPFLDLDRFRFGPILFGILAFLGVIAVSFWALNRSSGIGTADGNGVTVTEPAGPTAESSTGQSVTAGTGISGLNDGSTSVTSAGTTSSSPTTTAPTTASSSTSAATSSTTASTSTSSSSSTSAPSTTTTATTTSSSSSVTTATTNPTTTATTNPSTSSSETTGTTNSSTTASSSTSTSTSTTVAETAPTVNISSTSPASNSIQVSFTSNQCITRYRVSATGPDNSPVVVARVLTGTPCRKSASVTLNGLDANTAYALSVIVYNSGGLDGRKSGSASTTA